MKRREKKLEKKFKDKFEQSIKDQGEIPEKVGKRLPSPGSQLVLPPQVVPPLPWELLAPQVPARL